MASKPGTGEESLYSAGELKLLVAASQDAGLLQDAQEEVVVRTLDIGNRKIGDIMTPRTEVDWIDTDDSYETIVNIVRASPYDQLLVGRGTIDNLLGAVAKKDLLEQALAGRKLDPEAAAVRPLLVHEAMPLAGDLAGGEGELPDVTEREDGSFLVDGMTPAYEIFDLLDLAARPLNPTYHAIAGFALDALERLPKPGDRFVYEDWMFEVVDMDGRRIDKLEVRPRLTP